MNPYSEDQLIEQPAIALLAEMGWETMDCFHEFEQTGGSPLGRENKGEVVLTKKLRPALEKLNLNVSSDAIDLAIEELMRTRAVMSLVEANREIYGLLKDGVKVTMTDPDGKAEIDEVIQVIDWSNPENNDFFLASQFWIAGEMYLRRPDAVGFINGLPLVLIEFKRIDESIYSAYHDNLRDYKDTIPHLFWYNALILLSNGSDSKVGSLTASWEHFAEWKRISSENEGGVVSLDTILRGICAHHRLLDIVENFILFTEVQGGLIKILSKNHQYLGVNNAIEALKQIESNQGKLGVFWHTQGSGKSISMIFFAQKVLRRMLGHWTFVVVTDRTELDDQIYKNFASSSGVVIQEEVHAERVEHLRQLLREDQRTIAEQLSEEELTVFDLLTRPEIDLTQAEKDAVKAVAQKLLETLKREKFVLDWRKQERLRAAVKLTVEEILDDGLPKCYTENIFHQKCEIVYQHIYDSYYGAGSSVFAA